MANQHVAHSRDAWRKAGYYVEGTESINRVEGGLVRRKDLFGFADLVAIKLRGDRGDSMVYLQVTSWTNVTARYKKICAERTGTGQFTLLISDIVRALLRRGERVIIEGWKLNEKHRYVRRSLILYLDKEAIQYSELRD